MSLIIIKKTKDLFKEAGLKTSEEAIKSLNEEFEKMCRKASANVKAKNLKTVKKVHIPKMSSYSDSSE